MAVILITGSSSGIGKAAANLLSKKHTVYGTMRDPSKSTLDSAVTVLPLDVTEDDSVAAAVKTIIEKEGRIDVLINNAGYGLMGPIECLSIDQVKDEFEVNFFGLIRVTNAVLPHMRKQKSGHIINLSSIAGIRANPTHEAYNASKFAVEGLSEGMAPVLHQFGIKMTLIEPGPVETEFIGGSMKKPESYVDPKYEEIHGKRMANLHERFKTAQKPEEIAKIIEDVIEGTITTFRVQTSEWVKRTASEKLVDLSGDIQLQKAVEQL